MSAVVKAGSVAIGAGHNLFAAEVSNVAPLATLIRQLRHTIHATLPEITEVPETQDQQPVGTDGLLNTPFLALVGHAPRPADSAVNDQTQTYTFDFVYVVPDVQVGVVDMQENVRDRLRVLNRALMADYRQSGAANATRLVSDPGETGNRYKNIFVDSTQPVTALELTMEFDVIESLI